MKESPFIIAGAGLAGLSAARALPGVPLRVLEAEREPGGLCRSISHDGYTFDYSGHLLHLGGEDLAAVERILGGPLPVFRRRARIRLMGRDVEYPFQAHVGALPPDLRDECLAGFESAARGDVDRSSFASWSRTVFGEGITRLFMRPYNEKLLLSRLEDLSADGVQYVPRPKIEEVRAGARGGHVEGIGYNAVFRYPAAGGIGVLPAALARGLEIETGAPLSSWNASRREVCAGGRVSAYRALLSSIPLPALVARAEDAPPEIRAAANDLKAVGVLCLNLGVRTATSDAHWIYFPEPDVSFFRVGFYHNFCPAAAPPGRSALYVEISYRRREDLPPDIRTRAIRDLVSTGIVRDAGDVETCHEAWIDAAYALHTPRRTAALGVIRPWLSDAGVTLIGRYGRWGYISMTEALREGRETGALLRAIHGA